MHDVAILYEHPAWFAPLFAVLDRRGVDYIAIHLRDLVVDPAAVEPPARVVLSRVAMSAPQRDAEHGLFAAEAALAQWAARGAMVLNGAGVLAVDRSKARQLSLIAGLGLGIPPTRVVHRADQVAAAADAIGFPLVVKANVGGAGAGIVRFDTAADLATAVGDGALPVSIDGVLLVQGWVPARGGVVTRLETLGGKFLYALDIVSDGGFDLCPADACVAAPGRAAVTMTRTDPSPEIIDAAEAIARAVGLDLGGIEVMIDDRDGSPRFYDVNALSNFVADPLAVLGWDPHERLVDLLVDASAATGGS